jgi:hypothetical protein
MRIIFDGRQVESLEPKVVRGIGPLTDTPVAEGVIVATGPLLVAEARGAKIGLWVLGGIVAAILVGAGIMAVSYEPDDIVVVGPLYLAILAGMGFGGPAVYRLATARRREELARRAARTAPAGTAVRVDANGVTLAGKPTRWPDITIEAVEIVSEITSEGNVDGYHIDAVLLDMAGQKMVLDQGLTTNGDRIFAKILLTKGADAALMGGNKKTR